MRELKKGMESPIILLVASFFVAGSLMCNVYSQPSRDSRVNKIVSKVYSIDTHNHVDVPLDSAHIPGPKLDLAQDIQKSGLSAICMTFAVDYQRLTYPGEAYNRFLNGLTAMDSVLKYNNMRRALTANDIVRAHSQKKPIVIQSVEGGHFLEGKIDRLQIAYNRGLRLLTILHDNDASEPLGDVYTNKPHYGGLTDFGALVVKECERLGILIDLTHCDNRTIDMVLKIATKPVIISHTGLDTRLGSNEFMAKIMRPRLISKEQAKKVADAGGLIGVWAHLADTPEEYAYNIRAMVDVVGVNHVCIGTDSKLTTPYHGAFNPNQKENDRPVDKKEGSDHNQGRKSDNMKQNSPQGERTGERTNLLWKGQTDGFMYAVVDALLKIGFSEADIEKISGGNFLRVFGKATKKS